MFSKLNISFRTKIFIVLGAVVFLSLATFLIVLQETTRDRINENIQKRFENTINAFRELQNLRTQFASDEINSLAVSNTQFRTILSTASVGTEDLGFDLATDQNEILKDANLRLKSLLPFLPIYQKSDVFVVTNAEGEILLSKAEPDSYGENVSNLPLVQSIFREGEAISIWNSYLNVGSEFKVFLPKGRAAIYQIVGKPVAFGEEIYGVVLWGSRIDKKTLESIKEISSVEIVLYSKEGINASTLPPNREVELSKLINSKSKDLERISRGIVGEVSLGGEKYMTMMSSILSNTTMEEGGFIVLKSLTEELGFLKKLQVTFLLIGGGILLIAIVLSFLLSGGVTKPVRALALSARKIGSGELDTRVDIRTGDELQELGDAFNEMVKGLREREFIKSTFERYVSKAVASEIIKNPDMVRLGGMKRELTVMFSDIGGFTTASETIPPEDAVKHLNEYFEGMSSAILEYNGTINQFQGDAIVAFWGAPVPQENHAILACLAALKCREFLKSLQEKWTAQGLPVSSFRFGISTGEMVVGNIGSSSRFEYTVIGDEVNLTSRLEGVNKIYGTQILITDKTYELVREELISRELDVIRVVGKNQPVRIYELVAEKGTLDNIKSELIEKFHVGLNLHRQRRWVEALDTFEKILKIDPKDPPSQEYLRRCIEYLNSPPPPGW